MCQNFDPNAPRCPTGIPSPADEAVSKEARIAAERFCVEIDRSVEEHTAYLQEYGSLADAVRAMEEDTGRDQDGPRGSKG